MKKVNLEQKLSLFKEYWSPRIVGELNDQYVKLAKLKGEFIWHKHENEDEMFLVLQGNLIIKIQDNEEVFLEEGEFFIVPRNTEHKTIAAEEVHVLVFEPKTTLTTGSKSRKKTEKLERI
jgi:mannose-6-phosphate isomerase-like protein (cupin superfamily)